MTHTSNQQRFLIIQTAFIGDTILSTALAEKLHQEFPDARIDLFIRKGNEGLFTAHPFITRLYVWEKKKGRKYRSLLSLLSEIRSVKYGFCINLQRHGTTGFLTLFSGAKKFIGFTMNPLSRFFDYTYIHKINPKKELPHEVDVYLQLLGPIVSLSGRTLPRLYPTEEDFNKVHHSDTYVTIAPASVWFTKQFPMEKWVQLTNLISHSITVILIGGPNDRALCEKIVNQTSHPKVISRAGEFSLLQSVALLKGAIMNYANDSSPVHMASSIDAPTTVVFCSTTPAFGYSPLSSTQTIIQTTEKLACRPCGPHGHKSCPKKHFKCAEIDVNRLQASLHSVMPEN